MKITHNTPMRKSLLASALLVGLVGAAAAQSNAPQRPTVDPVTGQPVTQNIDVSKPPADENPTNPANTNTNTTPTNTNTNTTQSTMDKTRNYVRGMANQDMGASSYIGLNGGNSDFSRIGNRGNGLFSSGTTDSAYSLTFGNYGLNSNLGFELGYTSFGQVSRGGGTTKAEGINLSLIGRAPLSSRFNLLGKVGTTYGHTDVSANALSGVTTGSESGFDWSYGVGAELVISPQWSAVLQYDEAFLKFPGSGNERVSTTTLGARMRF